MSNIANEENYKRSIAHSWIKLKSIGKSANVVSYGYENQLEPDGRKRGKVISHLCSKGYMNMIDGKLHITSKAFDEIKGEKPDLSFEDTPTARTITGYLFDSFTLEAMKYIVDHKDDYKFFFESHYSDKTKYPVKFGSVPTDKDIYCCVFKVVDVAFEESRKKFIEDEMLKNARKHSLGWGLCKLNLLEDVNLDVIKMKVDNNFFSRGVFGSSPDNWHSDLNCELESLQRRAKEITRAQEVLSNLSDKIKDYGGWDNFINEYDKLILEKVKNDDNEKQSS